MFILLHAPRSLQWIIKESFFMCSTDIYDWYRMKPNVVSIQRKKSLRKSSVMARDRKRYGKSNGVSWVSFASATRYNLILIYARRKGSQLTWKIFFSRKLRFKPVALVFWSFEISLKFKFKSLLKKSLKISKITTFKAF